MLLLVTAVSLIYAEEGKMETPRVTESTSESEESNSERQESSSPEQGSNKANDNIYDVGSDSDIVPVEDIELEKYEKTLYVGETLSLTARVLPTNATEQRISYKSSDVAVATVSSTGTVTGISPGSVSIQLSAGDFVKSIDLTVEIKTSTIKLSSSFVVLKPGEAYQITAAIYPENATHNVLSYAALDSKVATVSSTGLVTAHSCGTTTVTVSNKDCIASATIVVNERTGKIGSKSEESGGFTESSAEYPLSITAKDIPVIESDVLKFLYDTQQTLVVVGDGYELIIAGDKIRNYYNEIATNIDLHTAEKGLTLNLNNGGPLCGAITLKMDGATNADDLYLYNASKDTYQKVRRDKENQWVLTSPGTYLLTDINMQRTSIVWWVLPAAGVIVIGFAAIYIITKKRYWFW